MIRPAVFGNIVSFFLCCQSIRSFGVGHRPSKQLFCRGVVVFMLSLIRDCIDLVVDEVTWRVLIRYIGSHDNHVEVMEFLGLRLV